MHAIFARRVSRLVLVVGAMLLTNIALADYNERFRVFYGDRWVEYFERDGVAIAEGDIVLGSAPAIARMRDHGDLKALAIDRSVLLWPVGPSGAHEVPYIYEAGTKANIDDAVAMFNAIFAGIIQWVPRVAQSDYVSFNLTGPGGSCNSSVGRVGGKQQIAGDPNCSAGNLLHEMGHAIGFWHVQSDAAQGQFLNIRYDIMDPRWRAQYRVIPNARTLDGYDYGSIMHYGPLVQSTTPDPLTASTMPNGIDIGQRIGYSASDVDAVKRLYGSTPSGVTVSTNPPGLDVIVDGQQVATPVTFAWRLGSLHRLDVPAGLQQKSGFNFGF